MIAQAEGRGDVHRFGQRPGKRVRAAQHQGLRGESDAIGIAGRELAGEIFQGVAVRVIARVTGGLLAAEEREDRGFLRAEARGQ